MTTLQLKTGQVAAVVGIPAKQVQNDVDAGYVQPTVAGQGRGSVRLFRRFLKMNLPLVLLPPWRGKVGMGG
jgi:hypothetical protein